MTSTSVFPALPYLGASLAVAAALAGCSTVKDISPFGSNVPYAASIKPNLPQPAVVEIPAFKPAPKPLAPPKPAEPPEPAPAVAAEPAPPAAPPSPAPAQPAAAPAPAQPEPAPAAPPAASTPPAAEAPATAPPSAAPPSTAPPAVAPPAAPPPGNQSSVAEPSKAAAGGQPKAADSDQAADADLPTIPAERRAFNDNGRYPNLAQVPSRPVNMPTFAEAAAIEKSLQSDEATAKAATPASPAAPSPDSAPSAAAQKTAAAEQAALSSKPQAPVVPRLEDRSPCLDHASGNPVLTVRFKPGSAALTSDDLTALVDALPAVRSSSGTIRIFGHGDTETGSPQGAARFDLAAARAGAVAQALAGYGIPVSRVAVGVACMDTAVAGASVQLYAES